VSVFHGAPVLEEGANAFAIADAHPLSFGHALVCPRREVATLDELTPEEAEDLWALVSRVKRTLRQRLPDCIGVRLMINEGAPQHIAHLHVHVIPWYAHMKP
jgi:diadenosine tetraphosphate (Ap4A) HIT family hydrolase